MKRAFSITGKPAFAGTGASLASATNAGNVKRRAYRAYARSLGPAQAPRRRPADPRSLPARLMDGITALAARFGIDLMGGVEVPR